MTSIYLVSSDGKTIVDEFKGHVDAKITINDSHTNALTFEIEANKDTEILEAQSRLLVKYYNQWFEFIVQEVEVFYGPYYFLSIKAYPSYDDLKVVHFLEPFSLPQNTVAYLVDYVLYDSGWLPGNIDYTANQRSFSSDHIKSAYDLIKEISNIIGHEIRFRISVNEETNRITRFVDLVIDDERMSGKELKFNRDIIKLTKRINYSEVFTQLHVIGPETEGTTIRPTVTVEDPVAYEFFNRNGKHVTDIYEPSITADLKGYALTERLKVLGNVELHKRNKEALEWEVDIARLDSQEGYEHEAVKLYDWVLIRNTYENKLYKARIAALDGLLNRPELAVATFSNIKKVGDI